MTKLSVRDPGYRSSKSANIDYNLTMVAANPYEHNESVSEQTLNQIQLTSYSNPRVI